MKELLKSACILVMVGVVGCNSSPEKTIITVLGAISASEIGNTLVHEHVLVDFIGADSTGYHRWNKEEVVKRVSPYFTEIRKFNVNTLFECTPAFIGRDPWVLKTLSEKTGMHIVTNTGYYGANNNRFIPAHFYDMSAEELSGIWIEEFNNGIEESGVKPGFIKIGVDGDDQLSPEHKKLITAAALTHLQTGMAIASHTGPDKPALEQIEVLQSHGIDPSAFIWVHAQNGTPEGNIKAALAGTWISLDNVNLGIDSDKKFDINWYAERIKKLKDSGLIHKILISHDAGWYSPGEENGGDFRGYTRIFTELIPALRELGFSQKEVDQIVVKNPGEAFSLRIR